MNDITPTWGIQGNVVTFRNLAGTGFLTGAKVKLTHEGSSAIAARNVVIVSPTKITGKFRIPAEAPVGGWNVVVKIQMGSPGKK